MYIVLMLRCCEISTVQIYTHINLRDSLEAIKKHPIHNNLGDD